MARFVYTNLLVNWAVLLFEKVSKMWMALHEKKRNEFSSPSKSLPISRYMRQLWIPSLRGGHKSMIRLFLPLILMFSSGCAIVSRYGAQEPQVKSTRNRVVNLVFKFNRLEHDKKLRYCFSEDEIASYKSTLNRAGIYHDPLAKDTIEVEITNVTELNYLGPINGMLSLATLTIFPLYAHRDYEIAVTYRRGSENIHSEKSLFGNEMVLGALYLPTAIKQSYVHDLRVHRAESIASAISKIRFVEDRKDFQIGSGSVGFDSAFDKCSSVGESLMYGI
ncbi:hypothetical protein [Bdellovibrio bacteriovorus]|uniref:hypothetical protein n=1 Tax=Bdellovibrio bacteriovorus TaxID=959 RepID=UPI0035A82664